MIAERVILTVFNRENAQITIEGGFGMEDQKRKEVFYQVGLGNIVQVFLCASIG